VKASIYTTALTLLGLLVITITPTQLHGTESAKSLYKQGQIAEASQDYDAAYNAYRKAILDDAGNLKYKTACERTRPLAAAEHVKRGKELREDGKTTGALTEFIRASAIDPSNEAAEQAIASLERQILPNPQQTDVPQLPSQEKRLARLAAPVELKPISDEPITLNMVEDTKIVYQSLCKAAGINVLFDPEYNSKRISIDLTDTSLEDALRIVATASGTFWKPITRGTIFVAADTRVKRTQLEQQAIQVFYLANSTQQNDLNDIQTALRNVLTEAKLYGVQSQNAIVMRGTPDQLLLAAQLINDLDKARPEVMIDVTVMQADKDKVRNIGLQWPQTLSVSLAKPSSSSSSSSSTLTLNDLAYLNAKNFSLTVGTAQANMLLTDSDTQILQNPRLRAADGQKATMKIGERIPVATGSFSAPTGSSAANPYVNTQFQYIDIGVIMEVTPTIHYDGDVTLKVKVEITSHNSDTTISGVTEPVIGQQSVEEMIRLKEGESNILGGLLQEQNNLTVSGTPGLGEVPLLKYLFSTQQRAVQHDEIVFLITPHLVRGMQIEPLNLRQIDTGAGNSIQLREVQTTPVETTSAPK
jgi:general secretion pathway protein D